MRVVFAVLAMSTLLFSSAIHLMYVLDEGRVLKFENSDEGVTIVEATMNILPILVRFDDLCSGEKVVLSEISKIDTQFGEIVFEITDSKNLRATLDEMKFYYQMVNPILNSIEFEHVDLEDVFRRSIERYKGLLDGEEILKLLGFLGSFENSSVDSTKIEEILKDFRGSILSGNSKAALEDIERVLEMFNENLSRLESSRVADSNIENLIKGVKTFCSMERKLSKMEEILKCRGGSSCLHGSDDFPSVKRLSNLVDLSYRMVLEISGMELNCEAVKDLKALVRYTRSRIESKLMDIELSWYDLKLILIRLIENM